MCPMMTVVCTWLEIRISGTSHHFFRFPSPKPRPSPLRSPAPRSRRTPSISRPAYNTAHAVEPPLLANQPLSTRPHQRCPPKKSCRKSTTTANARVVRWEAWALGIKDGGDAAAYGEGAGRALPRNGQSPGALQVHSSELTHSIPTGAGPQWREEHP